MNYRIDIDIENIKSLLNINESELADALDVPRSTLYRWKKGELEAAKAYWYEKFKGNIVRITYLGRDESADWDNYY